MVQTDGDEPTELVRLSVREGAVVGGGSWVYVWRRAADGRVVYVGGTGLPPAARTWAHLAGAGPDVARVRHRYAGAMTEDLDVLAFRLPDDVRRADVKAALTLVLSAAGVLADPYVGDLPVDAPVEGRASRLARAVADRLPPARDG